MLSRVAITGRADMDATGKTPAVDWSAWRPGWFGAAQALNDIGLARLLSHYDIPIQGLSHTALAQISTVLEDGLAQGTDVASLGRKIRTYVDGDRGVALTIANTVMACAAQAASMRTYVRSGVKQLDWLAGGPNECAKCRDNAAASPYALADFPELPAHSLCACASSPHF
jgi:hypothetical protein